MKIATLASVRVENGIATTRNAARTVQKMAGTIATIDETHTSPLAANTAIKLAQ